jgi:hypothetical protein
MYPEHRELFDNVKAANARDFTELRRLLAEMDRLLLKANTILKG